MLDATKENFVRLKRCYDSKDMESTCENIHKAFTRKDQAFSIFTTLSTLDTMVILYDDKVNSSTRYISFSQDPLRNYLVLSADRTIEELRFDAACMLAKITKKMFNTKSSCSPTYTTVGKNFSREEKHFACALLMPKKEVIKYIRQKDANGNYIHINQNNKIPLKNIHIIADYFGVPFNQCASRIFNILEEMRTEDKEFNLYIEKCHTREAYKKMKKSYTEEQKALDLKEMVPNHRQNRAHLINHFIDSLHFRSWSRLSDVAKRRLLINLVKADSVNEGVVKSEEEAKAIINNYIASGGTIYNGNLITKDGEYELNDEQLVVLGEYELYSKTLERGLIAGIAKSNPRLGYIVNLDYKEALNCISERDLSRYICDLHERLFSKLSFKYGEQRGGYYRTSQARLAGTNVSPAEPRMISQLMDNISWRILDTLKKNADGKLTNSQYIDQINSNIYEMIRMQPFSDGNKRTSRLLSNILYQEKGLPYVFVPVKDWDNYVNAWSSDNIQDYNEMMHDLIVESYQHFYGAQSVSDITNDKSYGKHIITANSNQR